MAEPSRRDPQVSKSGPPDQPEQPGARVGRLKRRRLVKPDGRYLLMYEPDPTAAAEVHLLQKKPATPLGRRRPQR